MNPGRFYIPGYMGIANNYTSPMFRMASTTPRGIGLFGRITNGIRSVNWGNLLNNANKTLNVVNQTIPLVRQAGPMVNNMKSMLKIAKAFGRETGRNNSISRNTNNNYKDNNTAKNNTNNISNNSYNNENLVQKKEVTDNNYLNFFI